MPEDILHDRDFMPELTFSASRSSGPGGQHVNKVNTKVELRFRVMDSQLLTESEKLMIIDKLAARINLDGELVLVSQRERSQLKNKEGVIGKFYELLKRALAPRKKRKPSKPSAAAKEKRLMDKKSRSEKKERRSVVLLNSLKQIRALSL